MQDKTKNNKTNVYIKVNDYTINTIGTIRNNIITCIDNNDKTTKVKYEIKDKILIRETKDITIKIDLLKEEITYVLLEENKSLVSPIKTIKIYENKQHIKIDYLVEDQKFNLEIKY